MSLLSVLLLLFVAAAQGIVISGTAWVGLRLLNRSHRTAKIAATLTSSLLWIALTIAIYSAMGGDGGLMDGLGLVLVLCCTALIGSFAYLWIWIAREAA